MELINKRNIYFPNLNGLRCFAALLVIFHHIEGFKELFKIENYWEISPFINVIGDLGVILFFVLSGFLITYLLLEEEYVFKKVNVKKFYIRRILRIWPLYFLIIILSLFILPYIDIFDLPGFGKEVVFRKFTLKIILFVLFFPNLVLAIYGAIPYASQTWSIGTEEQFYLVWPIILRFFKKYRIGLMIIIIIIYWIITKLLSSHFSDSLFYRDAFKAFWRRFNIDCMAIGGIYAILLFQKSRYLKLFMNNFLFYIVLIGISILIGMGVYIPYFHHELYAFLFGIIILNFAANENIYISLENNVLNYLGKISYGLYMYHSIGIVLSLYLVVSINCVTNWLIYPLSLIITTILASLSYRYFESAFLVFKAKFSNIISGEKALPRKKMD